MTADATDRDRAEVPSRAVELLYTLQQRVDFPLSATIELNRRCNLRCAHCYVDMDQQRGLPNATLRRILDELAEAGTLFVTFTGGEVTLRQDWLELAEYARERGFAVRIKTNGTKLSDEDCQRLADLPVLSVDISLYGATAETHDAITDVPGSWERAVSAMAKLRERKVRVAASIAVMSTNASEIEPLARQMEELGCAVTINPRITHTLDAERDNRHVVPAQPMVDRAVAAAEVRGAPRPSTNEKSSAKSDPWPCLSCQTGLYIRADGELRRCAVLPLSYGSVADSPVRDVWLASPMRKQLAQWASRLPEACLECDIAWACHRCAAHAWLEHKGLTRPAAIDCQLARARAKGTLVASDARCNTPDCGAHPCGDTIAHESFTELSIEE